CIAHANRSEASATRYSASMPVVVAPSAPPFAAVSPVSESEQFVFVAVLPVSEYESPVAGTLASKSESRAATVPSAVTRVVPIDELSCLLVMDSPTPAFIVGECNGGQRQTDDHRQGGSQQSKPQSSQFEHGFLLV